MNYQPERRQPDRKRVLRLHSSELNRRTDRGRIPLPIRKIVPIQDHNRVSLPLGRRNAASCVRLNTQSPTEIPADCHFDALAMRASWIARYDGSLRMSNEVV